MPTLTTSPWDQAVERFSAKTLVGSRLRSAEWADVPLALRDQALFSAGVENVRTLSAMRDKVLDGLTQARPGGTGMDRSRFVAEMRGLLGAAPGDSGDLTDITSRRRLELIWDFQSADAHGHASYKADMDPDVLDAYPAQRLVRIESRRVPRDWYDLWAKAGASVGWEGASKTELVALKTSPIWAALSRFGRPWPPFDYGSGMGLEDVERDEAEALGLLPAGEDPAARLQRLRDDSATSRQNWNDGLQASVKGLSPEARGWLSSAFGDQVAIEGDVAKWQAKPVAPYVPAPAELPVPPRKAPVSRTLDNTTEGELHDEVRRASRAIDVVHDDGVLPRIPVTPLTAGNALGHYSFQGVKAVGIAIRNDSKSWPALTSVHEAGHFIDHQALDAAGHFASSSSPLLSDFRKAVDNTEAMRTMRAMMPPGSYFLKPQELWARSYAQYVATRSGDARLLAQLDKVRGGKQPWRQWSDEDFKPVAAAIDALFRKKGWIQ